MCCKFSVSYKKKDPVVRPFDPLQDWSGAPGSLQQAVTDQRQHRTLCVCGLLDGEVK